MFFSRKPKELPWILEGKKVWGWHEVRNRDQLRQWLRSDGKTLGDPKALPWCGDYTETAIKNSLPSEVFRGKLAENPYWARNWEFFGVATELCYGCVVVFSRGSGGHVGFAVGEDTDHLYVLGGNQSDAVTIVRIAKNRLLAARWPSSFANPNRSLPAMSANGIPVSTNEF